MFKDYINKMSINDIVINKNITQIEQEMQK